MFGNSSFVQSNQSEIHEDLAKVLHRHLSQTYQRPISAAAKAQFKDVEKRLGERTNSLILDSGCGNGISSCNLAEQFPESFVLGIDKSAFRLSHKKNVPRNCLLIRAELVDFWRLAEEARWKLQRHYLLYPNPWPKRKHLMRRWHAHPVFPSLLALGGRLELRSNWKCYVEEFSESLHLTGKNGAEVKEVVVGNAPISPFERKYRASDHALYSSKIDLDSQ